jgi:D-glycero-D-manno-heptose 1,7-bisphosphate phosphatase
MHRLTHEAGGNIEAIFFCTATDDTSPCRKPNPGMLEDIGRRLRIRLKNAFVVGDDLRDIQAARAVGARPILVRTGKGGYIALEKGVPEGVLLFDDLAAAADYLLRPDTS